MDSIIKHGFKRKFARTAQLYVSALDTIDKIKEQHIEEVKKENTALTSIKHLVSPEKSIKLKYEGDFVVIHRRRHGELQVYFEDNVEVLGKFAPVKDDGYAMVRDKITAAVDVIRKSNREALASKLKRADKQALKFTEELMNMVKPIGSGEKYSIIFGELSFTFYRNIAEEEVYLSINKHNTLE